MSKPKQTSRPRWVSTSEFDDKQFIEHVRDMFNLNEVTHLYSLSRPLAGLSSVYRMPDWFFKTIGIEPALIARGIRDGQEILCIRLNTNSLELLSFCPLLALQIAYEPGYELADGDRMCSAKFAVEQWFLFNIMVREQIGYQTALRGDNIEDTVLEHMQKWVEQFFVNYKSLPLLQYLRTEPVPIEEQFEHWVRTQLKKVVRPFGHTVHKQNKQQVFRHEETVQTLLGDVTVSLVIDNLSNGFVVDKCWAEQQKVVGNEVQYLDAALLYVQSLRKLPLKESAQLNNAHFTQLVIQSMLTDYDNRFLKSLLVYYPYDNEFRNVAVSYARYHELKCRLVRQVFWLVEQMQMNYRKRKQVTQFWNCSYCPIQYACRWLGSYVETSKVGDVCGITFKKLVRREGSQ